MLTNGEAKVEAGDLLLFIITTIIAGWLDWIEIFRLSSRTTGARILIFRYHCDRYARNAASHDWTPPVGSSGAVANQPSLSRASPTHLMNGAPIATTWAGGEAQPQPQPPHPRPALPHLDAQRPPDQRPVGRGPMARLSDPDGDQQTAGRRAARQPDVPGHSIHFHARPLVETE
jgi:hypothetical protein